MRRSTEKVVSPSKATRQQRSSVVAVVKTTRPKARKGRARPRAATKVVEQLSPCARDYALALRDPFEGPIACVPSSYPPLPSQKVRVWVRGTFAAGTQGVGGVCLNPFKAAANDQNCCELTDSTYADVLPFPSNTGQTGVFLFNSNAPYVTAQFGDQSNQVQARLVSAGVRAWPVGKEIDLGGSFICFRSPNNDTILDYAEPTLLAFQEARRYPISSSRSVAMVNWIPVTPDDITYTYSFTRTANCMGIAVTGTVGTSYAFEAAFDFEYIGAGAVGKTMSHADPAGFSAVLTAVESEGDSWYGNVKSAGKKLVSLATETLSGLSGAQVIRGLRYVHAGYGLLSGNAAPALTAAAARKSQAGGSVSIREATPEEVAEAEAKGELKRDLTKDQIYDALLKKVKEDKNYLATVSRHDGLNEENLLKAGFTRDSRGIWSPPVPARVSEPKPVHTINLTAPDDPSGPFVEPQWREIAMHLLGDRIKDPVERGITSIYEHSKS